MFTAKWIDVGAIAVTVISTELSFFVVLESEGFDVESVYWMISFSCVDIAPSLYSFDSCPIIICNHIKILRVDVCFDSFVSDDGCESNYRLFDL